MSDDLLVRAADRAASEPFYLSGPIRFWRTSRGASAEDVLAYLGVAVDRRIGAEQQLARIAICRRPTDRDDLHRISRRFGIVPARLAELVLEADRPGRLAGERHPRSKLTRAVVARLRIAVRAGATVGAACRAEKISKATGRDAITGTTWAHLTDPPPLAPDEIPVVRRVWTDAELAVLAEREDDAAPDVADTLGRTPAAIRQMRSKRGL
jgi:transcriptional regulator with XRE-family HTH domain